MAGTRERLGAPWRGRRRWWLAGGLALVAVLAVAVAISWHFSDAVLVPDFSSHAPRAEVEAMPPGRIVLARDTDSERPGVYGLEWPGGHAIVGAVVGRSDDTVTRRLRDVRGYLVPEMEVGIESDVFAGDPRQALGLPYRQVVSPGEPGPMPAWLVPADRRRGAGQSATWAIFVHGINGSRQNGLRLVPALHRAGLSALLISYREDQGAPASPDGFHHMGQTEWLDLEAAVRYALAHGARRLVLAGSSMGGAIVAQFMEKSALAKRVEGLVLDAPVLDWRATLEFHASEMGLPGFTAMPVEAATMKWSRSRPATPSPPSCRRGSPTTACHGPATCSPGTSTPASTTGASGRSLAPLGNIRSGRAETGNRTAPASDKDFAPGLGSTHIPRQLGVELVHADGFLQALEIVTRGEACFHRSARIESGASGARTHDLLTASQTLFQLSYSPLELVIGGPV